jgi:hypothetical protein
MFLSVELPGCIPVHACGCHDSAGGYGGAFPRVSQIERILFHQLVMGIDSVEVGIEGVGDLLLAQFCHPGLGEVQVQSRHQHDREDENADQQADKQHDR